MSLKFEDIRGIDIFVDESKNIVIFPLGPGKSMVPYGTGPGEYELKGNVTAYYPIELKYPYTAEELAEKIKMGMDEFCKHPGYEKFTGRNTFEEKYYGIKGFKNAMKGKRHISIESDPLAKKPTIIVTLYLPCKRGYAYDMIEKVPMPENFEYLDLADAVITLANLDLMTSERFKIKKSGLNI